MDANAGDIITFRFNSNNYDINVDGNIIYYGYSYEAVVVLKAQGYLYVCLPTKSGLGILHKVSPSDIEKVITPYNKFIEGL